MLTTAMIKDAQPGVTLYDDRVRGLHVRVSPKQRAFYLYFRTRGGLERRPKVGAWPTISLERAREIGREWLHIVAGGGDPVADWQQERGAKSVAELAATYLERHAATKKSGGEDKRMLDGYVLPALGRLRAQDVTRSDIEGLHAGLKKTPAQANRVLALASKMFALAERWEMRPQNSNPCHGIPRYRKAKRRRYMRPGEAGSIFAAIQRHAAQYPQQAAFLTLLMFTGARPGEIAAARWSDLRGNRIELAEHKTDRTGAVRVIFLPPQAMEAIERLPRTSGTITGIQSPRHLWEIVCAEAGIPDLRIYDLRHSFASAGLQADMTLAQIGELLGHRSTQTTLRYAHLMEERGVEQATRAADFLQRMAQPGTSPTGVENGGRQRTIANPLPIPD
jgi:integrase